MIKSFEKWMATLFLFGTLIAMGFILIGGILLLWQQGNQSFITEIMPFHSASNDYHIHAASSLDLINLGLIILVGTQWLRVVLLTIFYSLDHKENSYKMAMISGFVAIVMLYGFIWKH